mgnify:CR=1 FL=1
MVDEDAAKAVRTGLLTDLFKGILVYIDNVVEKVDRLLHLGQSRWEKVELPADWDVNAPAWLVTLSAEATRSPGADG